MVADIIASQRISMIQAEQNLFVPEEITVSCSDMPTVTHLDYSAWIQTVHLEAPPLSRPDFNSFAPLNTLIAALWVLICIFEKLGIAFCENSFKFHQINWIICIGSMSINIFFDYTHGHARFAWLKGYQPNVVDDITIPLMFRLQLLANYNKSWSVNPQSCG